MRNLLLRPETLTVICLAWCVARAEPANPVPEGAAAAAQLEETPAWSWAATLTREAGPGATEGDGALHVTVDEAAAGNLHLVLDLGGRDLTMTRQLRFRLHGGLRDSAISAVVIVDAERTAGTWRLPALTERSRQSRWTEYTLCLDVPDQDVGLDLSRVARVMWRVARPGQGTGESRFVLDGVRFDATPAAVLPRQTDVILEHRGMRAVFTPAALFELDRIELPDGQVLPLRTATFVRPLGVDPGDAERIVCGQPLRWTAFHADTEILEVAYERGDFKYETSFRWDQGMLLLQRRATTLRAGEGRRHSGFCEVVFGDVLTRYTQRRGLVDDGGDLPVTSRYGELQYGHWTLATAADGHLGAALIYPHRPHYQYLVDGRTFRVKDNYVFGGNVLAAGAEQHHELYLLPVSGPDAAARVEQAAVTLARRIAAAGAGAGAYFQPEYLGLGHGLGHVVGAGSAVVLWQTLSTVAVREDAPRPTARAPEVRVALARGETEPIHLVLSAEQPLEGVSVSCSELVCEGRVLPPDCVRVRYAGYVRVRPTTEAERVELTTGMAEKYRRYVTYVAEVDHGAELLLTPAFWYSRAGGFGAYEGPLYDLDAVDVSPGANRPVWITVRVPHDAKPGEYRGMLRVTAGGREACEVPLRVKVWAYALPRIASLPTFYQLWRYPEIEKRWRLYYANLAAHKVSGTGWVPHNVLVDGELQPVYPEVSWNGAGVDIDWRAYDTVLAYLFDELGMHALKLPHGKRGGAHRYVNDFAGLKENTPEFEAAFADYLRQARAHFAERGWLDRLYCYIFDEPDDERVAVVRRTAAIVRRAIPEMRIFTASSFHVNELAGIVNAWCVSTGFFGRPNTAGSRETVAAGRARGDSYWWYSGSHLQSPLISERAHHWATWKEGLDGYFAWSINYWGRPDRYWRNAGHQENQYGAFYRSPGIAGQALMLYPGKDGPVDSVHWETVRDSLEDYDMLKLLAATVAREDLSRDTASAGRRLLDAARALIVDPAVHWAVDPARLLERRQEIGDYLDGIYQDAPAEGR